MEKQRTHREIVTLIEPHLCVGCRFASITTVEIPGRAPYRSLSCKRLDCDNWGEVRTDLGPLLPIRDH
jgi:hypothetical protein